MDIGTSEPGPRRNWRDYYRQPNRPAWAGKLIKALLVLFIIIALVLLGRWINHALKEDNTQQPAGGTSQKAPAAPSANTQSGGTAQNNSGSSSGQTTNGGNTTATQLPNSGPGEVTTVFLASALAAAGFHYIVQTRKQNR